MLINDRRGDTIIEVMFALAILGLVLGFSYSSARNSQQLGQEARERAQATKLAESQIELLKADLSTGSRDVIRTTNFCMKRDATGVVTLPAGTPAADVNSDNYANYPNGPEECVEGYFHIGIDPDQLTPTVYEYRVTVRWDAPTGSRSEVAFKYKLVDE